MPPTNILVTDIDCTNTDKLHQVYLTDFNTLTQLGDDIDDTSLGAGSFNNRGMNYAISAWGSVYCMSREGIYRLQTGSQFGTWSRAPADGGYTFDFPALNTQRGWSGIFFISIDNTPYLVGHYADQVRIFKFNLLTGEGEESSNSFYGGDRRSNIIYGGLLYTGDGFDVWVSNLVGLNLAVNATEYEIVNPGSGVNSIAYADCADWHIFNDKLYMLAQSRPTGSGFNGLPTLYEYDAGSYKAIVNDFESVATSYGTTSARWCLFDDGTRMYVIYWDDQAGQLGWNMWEVNLVGGQWQKGNELTSTVLPAGLRPGGGPSNTSAWAVYKDLQSDGTVDIYLIYSASSGASTSTLYQFTNSTTELTSVGSGIDSRLVVSNSRFGGGERTVDLTAPSICVYARERNALGEKVTFRVFPPMQPAESYDGTNLIVNFQLASGYGVPLTTATLAGDVTGGSASRSGNAILNVESDGVTDYTAIISSTDLDHLENVSIIAEVN